MGNSNAAGRSVNAFNIGTKGVGDGSPCFVVAEIAQAHDGSLGAAHAYIEAVARTGVDAIKFQTHIADAESTPQEQFRVKIFPQDASRYDYWKRTGFTEDQWQGLVRHAEQRGLIFLSTPFSFEAVDMLERLGIPAWKIGSGEIGNLPLLKKVARTGKPVLISSGMSPWEELDDAVSIVSADGCPFSVMQCTTSYPCPADKIGLNVIAEMRERYQCPVGFSDHSGAIYASLAAVTLGVNVIEVHAVFSKDCFGPDVSSSLTIDQLGNLVEGIRFVEKAIANPVKKDREAEERKELRSIFGRSLVARHDISAGHILSEDDLALKKPAGGMPAKSLGCVVGRKLLRDYKVNEFIREDDVE